MTAQAAEILRFEGKEVIMFTQPLRNYFQMTRTQPDFIASNSTLWRAYIGTWEILAGRLYLVHLEGTMRDRSAASVASIFPEYPNRVFAHWFSGNLRLPEGERIKYVHLNYNRIYERDRIISVSKGVVGKIELKINSLLPIQGSKS